MPRHDIWISFPAKRLKNLDTTIEIFSKDTKLGELQISQGTVDWKSRSKKVPRSITWERFAELLDAETQS